MLDYGRPLLVSYLSLSTDSLAFTPFARYYFCFIPPWNCQFLSLLGLLRSVYPKSQAAIRQNVNTMEQFQNSGQLRNDSSPASISASDIVRLIWRRLWVVVLVMSVTLGSAALISRRTKKAWHADAQMVLIQRSPAMTTSVQPGYSAPIIESTETQAAMLQDISMARRTIDSLKQQAIDAHQPTDTFGSNFEERADIIEKLQKSITVSVPKETNILDVQVEGESAEQAADMANAVCKTFVTYKQKLAQEGVTNTTDGLAKRVKLAESQMIEAEGREMAFKQSHHLVDIPIQEKAALDQYLSRNTEVQSLKQETMSLEARLKALGDQLKGVNQAISTGESVRNDADVLSLQTQLKQHEMELADASLRYTHEYPGVLPEIEAKIAYDKDRLSKAVKGTIANKNPSLQAQGALVDQYAQAQVAVLYSRARLDAAVALRDQLEKNTKNLPQTSMEFARLARNAELSRGLHSQLKAAFNSTSLDKDFASGNVQISSLAEPPSKPFRPNLTRDVILGGAIGLFISLISVLLLEQADRRIRSIEDVKRLVSGPIVGSLPKMSRSQLRGLLNGTPPPHAIEAYSMARANLSLAVHDYAPGAPWQRQIVLITSALPGEGKSVTAAQLAKSLARAGTRVVLVDADLRRPTQNKLFHTAEPHGLAEVLSGEMQLDQVLVDTEIPNLSILHSGTADRNPTELISSLAMQQTLEMLRSEAEVIVVDAPACAIVADALFLAPHADCILHVIGVGQVDETLVRDTTAALAAAAPKTMAFFVNRVARSRSDAYKGYYAYASAAPRHRPLTSSNGASGAAPAISNTGILEAANSSKSGHADDAIDDPIIEANSVHAANKVDDTVVRGEEGRGYEI